LEDVEETGMSFVSVDWKDESQQVLVLEVNDQPPLELPAHMVGIVGQMLVEIDEEMEEGRWITVPTS
jgi:hypothetical protein